MKEEARKIDLMAKLSSQNQALEQLSKGKKHKNIPYEKVVSSNIHTDNTAWQSELREAWKDYEWK